MKSTSKVSRSRGHSKKESASTENRSVSTSETDSSETKEELPPWHRPVSGDALITDLVAFISKYVIVSRESAHAIAAWVIHTYALSYADNSPVLAIISPLKRCGKTRLLDVLGVLVHHPEPTANTSPAVIYRLVDQRHPTILIDEADTFLIEGSDLNGILNSGHTKSTAFVTRNIPKGRNWVPERFSTWCAKAIAKIGSLPPTLADRSISIVMKRRVIMGTRLRFRAGVVGNEALPLKRKMIRWVKDNGLALAGADPAMPNELNDRAADNWRPLLAIGDAIGGQWKQGLRDAALALQPKEDEDMTVELLQELRSLLTTDHPREKSANIINHLVNQSDSQWADFHGPGRPLTRSGLAKMLRPFGIRPKKFRFGESSYWGYEYDQAMADVFTAYLPPKKSEQTEQTESPSVPSVPDVPDSHAGEREQSSRHISARKRTGGSKNPEGVE